MKLKITNAEITNDDRNNQMIHDGYILPCYLRRYSDSDSPYLPPKYTSKNSTLQSPKKTHPNNINDVKTSQISHDYDALVQNVIA